MIVEWNEEDGYMLVEWETPQEKELMNGLCDFLAYAPDLNRRKQNEQEETNREDT